MHRLVLWPGHRSPADGIWTYSVLDDEVREVGHICRAPDLHRSLDLLSHDRVSEFHQRGVAVKLALLHRGLWYPRPLGPFAVFLWVDLK